MRFLILMIAAFLCLGGCGNYRPEDAATKDAASDDQDHQNPTPTTPPPAATKEPAAAKDTRITGYISAAFAATVDGKPYDNMEAYYTAELGSLEEQAATAGYSGRVTFDAAVGFSDFAQGTKAFAISEGSGAFAATTSLVGGGSFTFTVPAEVTEVEIKTNKRISVTITPADRKIIAVHWCLNLSSEPSALDLTKTQRVLIQSFLTQVTRYACSSSSESGLAIPLLAAGS